MKQVPRSSGRFGSVRVDTHNDERRDHRFAVGLAALDPDPPHLSALFFYRKLSPMERKLFTLWSLPTFLLSKKSVDILFFSCYHVYRSEQQNIYRLREWWNW